MEKIEFEFFDFFGAVIPGIPVFIISCFLVNYTPFSFNAIVEFLKTPPLSLITIILLACYCIGFCFHYPAYELFEYLIKLWGPKRTLELPISIGEREKELSLIRQRSPENFKLINKFMALRQMAYSMFFSLTFFSSCLLILSILKCSWNKDSVTALIIAILFGFLFLRRAVAFHQRIQEMINEAKKICKQK